MRRLFIALGAGALVLLGTLAVAASGQTQNCTGPDYCPIPPQTTPPTATVLGFQNGKFKVPVAARGKGKKCAARNFLFKATVHTKNPLAYAKVFVDVKKIKQTKSKHVVALVKVRKLRPGQHKLTLSVKDAIGLTQKRSGVFVVCARAAALPTRRPGFTG